MQQGGDPSLEMEMGQGAGLGEPCSQGMFTVPLGQRLQFRHRKPVSPQYSRYWFFLQPHTVSRSTVQGEISTWNISGEGRRGGMSPHTPHLVCLSV